MSIGRVVVGMSLTKTKKPGDLHPRAFDLRVLSGALRSYLLHQDRERGDRTGPQTTSARTRLAAVGNHETQILASIRDGSQLRAASCKPDPRVATARGRSIS